ncbi:MAG: hypothetical protein ACTSWQ_05665, partial [Candidatus Thorarchaeota archaeon]
SQDAIKISQTIGIQMNLIAFEPVLYNESLQQYNGALSRFNALDEQSRLTLSPLMDELYNGLEHVRSKNV